MVLETIDIATWYYIGMTCGLVFMMVYQYWVKSQKDPDIAFDKKYLVPFLLTLAIAVGQLMLEVFAGISVPVFGGPLEAFWAGFIVWAGVQEVLKVILKYPSIDYFGSKE